MKLFIDNQTEFLNDYYFQTLCLLYFPGEKFGAGDEGVNRAYFLLKPEGSGFYACVRLCAGSAEASAEYTDLRSAPAVGGMNDEFYATRALGRAFLLAGKRLFGFSLPWGYLTGLRPVKRAKYYLDRGESAETVTKLFTDDYLVSAEKASLAVETAVTEEAMLADVGEKDCAVYVSIPFCPTRCDYCSFVSYSNERLFRLIPDYLVRLMQDIRRTGELIKELGMRVRAVYIGGGTPSILEPEQTDMLLDCIAGNIGITAETEFTFEAGRPDTITREKLSAVARHGVRRISVNPQSTSDTVLENIGRKHTARQFFEAAELARGFGFSCLNADLIAGLPGDNSESFAKSVEDMINCGFDNITVHTLSIKNAALIRFIGDGFYDPAGELARDSVRYARARLAAAGLYPYYLYRQKNTVGNAENTGFSVKGSENLYNVLMMEEYSTVFACGAGAISKFVNPARNEIYRHAFPKYPYEYLREDKGIGREEAIGFFSKG